MLLRFADAGTINYVTARMVRDAADGEQLHQAVRDGVSAAELSASTGLRGLALAQRWRTWADDQPRVDVAGRRALPAAEYRRVGVALFAAVRPDEPGESQYLVRCPYCHRVADVDDAGGCSTYECEADAWSWTPDRDQPYSAEADAFLEQFRDRHDEE